MPFRPQPLDSAYAPPRFPAPDWGKDGTVARVFVPDDVTVGWLIRQGDDALAWLSALGPDDVGYGIRRLVDDLVSDAAFNGDARDKTWDRVLAATLNDYPVDMPLAEAAAQLS